MTIDFLLFGSIPLLFSVLMTPAIRRFAIRKQIVDIPTSSRKVHTRPIPLYGGVAVISSFLIGLGLAFPVLTDGYLLPKHLIGITIASLILLIGGARDDRKNLSPIQQIQYPLLAALIIVTSGIGIDYITNPFGGIIRFDVIEWQLFSLNGIPYHFTLISDLFTVLWLTGMMYTTKFLDGLDGLVSGISVIGSLILFFLSISQTVFQPETALVALMTAAAFAGFLIFNWNPAKIFLGESGSLFAGFILGVLAIISGGKIATALLIMGIPILDVLWVIVRRAFIEKRSPFLADRKHLHLRLIDIGLTQRQAVLLLYFFTTLFGVSSLFLQSTYKLLAFGVMILTMIVLGYCIVRRYQRRRVS